MCKIDNSLEINTVLTKQDYRDFNKAISKTISNENSYNYFISVVVIVCGFVAIFDYGYVTLGILGICLGVLSSVYHKFIKKEIELKKFFIHTDPDLLNESFYMDDYYFTFQNTMVKFQFRWKAIHFAAFVKSGVLISVDDFSYYISKRQLTEEQTTLLVSILTKNVGDLRFENRWKTTT